MQIIRTTTKFMAAVLLAVAAAAFAAAAVPAGDVTEPELPASCGDIQVPEGNEPYYSTYAIGVQVYRWNGTGWDFVAPIANLYADPGYRGNVGSHYAGPVWESKSGSKVAARLNTRCTPDSNAIPWLRLQTVTAEGPGIFAEVTYIQRVNTVGGIAPAAPGDYVGEERQVPYTAEYYFYRTQ